MFEVVCRNIVVGYLWSTNFLIVCRNKGYVLRWKNLPLRFCKRPRPIVAFFATMLTAPAMHIYTLIYNHTDASHLESFSVVQCYEQLYYNKKLCYIITIL